MFKKLKTFFRDLYEILKKKEMLVLPGHLAFFFVLSIVPIITIIFFVATSFNLSLNAINDFIETNFSKEVLDLVEPILYNDGFTLSNVMFLLVTFFLASNGLDSIIIASNTIFNLNNYGYFKRRIKAFVLTFIMVFLFTFILIVPLFGDSLIQAAYALGFDNELIRSFDILYPVLNIPLSMFVVFFFIKLVYTIAPDDQVPSRYVNKGAFFTTVCWMLITWVYSYYINNIAHYNMYYGGLSSIVVLMLWFYLMAYVFVIGLAFNYRNVEERIEKTNTMKLDEIQEKVRENREKKISKK